MTVVRRGRPPARCLDGAGYARGPGEVRRPQRSLCAELALAGNAAPPAAEAGRAWRAHGDPMEAALDTLARRLGIDTVADRPPERRFPFDPRLRRMAVVLPTIVGEGGPGRRALRCGPTPTGGRGGASPRGLRVLAVAAAAAGTAGRPEEAERDLDCSAWWRFEDPPREDIPSRSTLPEVGVKVAMVTGDHPATATAIADEVGLLRPDAPVLRGRSCPRGRSSSALCSTATGS